jgi:hypothetical protein
MSTKNRLKSSNQSVTSRNPSNENAQTHFCRSRSIDSMSANDKVQSTGGTESNDEKTPNTGTLANKFRTLRKRLSRTSNSQKHEQAINRVKTNHNEKENAIKSGGDESEASSVGEEFTQVSFAELPPSNSDSTPTETSTAAALKLHRSLPLEKTPSIVTSPPADLNEKNDDNENANLSKTWSASTFTGAQLRGTCSLEYTEHMKDKSHKKKAHMIDLRKDDAQQQSNITAMTSTSKHSNSTSFTSYHSHSITVVNNKGALSSS